MPRYKDSPEVRAAKQERKDKLREFLSLLEVDDMHDLRSLCPLPDKIDTKKHTKVE